MSLSLRRRVYQEGFPLKTMLAFIRQAVERHFPLAQAVNDLSHHGFSIY